MSASVIAPATLGLTMDLFGHPALFYTAALTFVIAYLLLQTGIKQVKGKTA